MWYWCKNIENYQNTVTFGSYKTNLDSTLYFINLVNNTTFHQGQRVWRYKKQEGTETLSSTKCRRPGGNLALYGERRGGARSSMGQVAEDWLVGN